VQAATVAHHQATGGVRDDLTRRQHPVLERHGSILRHEYDTAAQGALLWQGQFGRPGYYYSVDQSWISRGRAGLRFARSDRTGHCPVTCSLGGKMTEQPPNKDRPDDWGRSGYVPGEQYYGEQYDPEASSSRPGAPAAGRPGPGPTMPPAPPWQAAPAQGAPANEATQQLRPQYRAGQQGSAPHEAGQQGAGQQGAAPYGAAQQGAPPYEAAQPGAFQQGVFPQQGLPRQGLPRQGADAKGFFAALFDFSFTSLVTTRIIKVLYALILVLAVLTALLYTVIMFRVSAGFGLATLIIGDPLFIIIVMAFWRLVLEAFVVVFRIAEDVRALRERGDR
jgi:hypothetical protein